MIRTRRARTAIAVAKLITTSLSALLSRKNQPAVHQEDARWLDERKRMYEQRGPHA